MKTNIYNNDNLKDEEVDTITTRVKVFLLNSKNEILIATTNDGCIQLPGGHQEGNEDLNSTIIREIKEETGITIDPKDISEPFFAKKYYVRNYKDTHINRLSQIYYFLIRTNKTYDSINIHLTEHEKSNGFRILSIPLEDLENRLIETEQNNSVEINRVIAKETNIALHILLENLK